MAVRQEQIRIGACFQFAKAVRRVKSFDKPVGGGRMVNWEYADGRARSGRLGGSQWWAYFQREAICEVPDPVRSGSTRTLRGGAGEVPAVEGLVTVQVVTHCPAKWALVDRETGEVWVHAAGQGLRRVAGAEIEQVRASIRAEDEPVVTQQAA